MFRLGPKHRWWKDAAIRADSLDGRAGKGRPFEDVPSDAPAKSYAGHASARASPTEGLHTETTPSLALLKAAGVASINSSRRAPVEVRDGFDPQVLLAPGHGPVRRRLEGDLRLFASVQTLLASIDMVQKQHDAEPSWFSPDGQRIGDVFFRRPGEEFMRAGPRAYFDQIDRLEVGFQTPSADDAPAGGKDGEPTDARESSIACVGRIVEFCRAAGIDLRIFITPSHVHQMEIATVMGAWPAVESGKRALVRVLAEDAARHPESSPIPAWDFSGYSSVTEEPLPDLESRAEMINYWDSSHFKSPVGDLVLTRVFQLENAEISAPADFGVRLTLESIDSALQEQRASQSDYRRRHPDDIRSMSQLIRSSKAHLQN